MTNPITDAVTREQESFDVYDAIVATLTDYIEGAKTGDADRIRNAFADHANIAGTVGGEFSVGDIDAFSQLLREIKPSPELRANIAMIDISGSAGVAKVEFINWSGMRYTDYLLLHQRDGNWTISGKVFDAHSHG